METQSQAMRTSFHVLTLMTSFSRKNQHVIQKMPGRNRGSPTVGIFSTWARPQPTGGIRHGTGCCGPDALAAELDQETGGMASQP
jgi:hypothetical protein